MPIKISKEAWTDQRGDNPAPYQRGVIKNSDGDYVISGTRTLGAGETALATAYSYTISAEVLAEIASAEWHSLIAHALYRAMLDYELCIKVYSVLGAGDSLDGLHSSKAEEIGFATLESIANILLMRAESSRSKARSATGEAAQRDKDCIELCIMKGMKREDIINRVLAGRKGMKVRESITDLVDSMLAEAAKEAKVEAEAAKEEVE